MNTQVPKPTKGLGEKILNSAVWLERIIYSGMGILLGLMLGIAGQSTNGFGFGMLVGFGIAIGFYVLQSFTLVIWATWGWMGKILAPLMLGPGVGLVILGVGDLIRWVAYQLYKGEYPIYFAFFDWKSKSDKPGGMQASL